MAGSGQIKVFVSCQDRAAVRRSVKVGKFIVVSITGLGSIGAINGSVKTQSISLITYMAIAVIVGIGLPCPGKMESIGIAMFNLAAHCA
jgi:hypothetical protein